MSIVLLEETRFGNFCTTTLSGEVLPERRNICCTVALAVTSTII